MIRPIIRRVTVVVQIVRGTVLREAEAKEHGKLMQINFKNVSIITVQWIDCERACHSNNLVNGTGDELA